MTINLPINEGVSSTRHHYLPQFYLENFCRPDGTFEVYDKKYSKFKSSPQSPATVFFEKDKNTIKLNNKKTDFIEKYYSQLETTFSELFHLIKNGISQSELLNSDGISLLKKYLAIQFWRLPILDGFAEQFILSRTLNELKQFCQVTVPPLNDEEIFKLIQEDAGFRHFFRCFMLPLCTFSLNGQIPDNVRWLVLDVEEPQLWSNLLISDTPFIFKKPENMFNFSGSFIFPLSNTKLLVSKHRLNSRTFYDATFSTKISIYFFLQSNRYVVATDKNYLVQIIELSKSYEGIAGFLKLQSEIFEYIE